MKRQFIFLLLLFSFSSLTAQEGTTLEEYRYLSKGYIYQLEMGLDAQKEGYTVNKIFTTSDVGELVGLYKNGQQIPRALLVILEPTASKTTYVCLPNAQAEPIVQKMADTEQSRLSSGQRQKLDAALKEFLFAAFSVSETPAIALHQQAQGPASYGADASFTKPETSDAAPTITAKSAETVVVPTTADFQYTPVVEPLEKSQPVTTKAAPVKYSKSTVTGELSTRSIIQNQAPAHTSKNRGIIAIKICVDRDGNVKSAKFTQRGSTTFNASLKKIALTAAKEIKFAKIDLAEQCGIVKYDFL